MRPVGRELPGLRVGHRDRPLREPRATFMPDQLATELEPCTLQDRGLLEVPRLRGYPYVPGQEPPWTEVIGCLARDLLNEIQILGGLHSVTMRGIGHVHV